MNTAEKCEEILKNIVERCNKDGEGPGSGKPVVSFAPDWGGNSLTLYIGEDHTHVGDSSSMINYWKARASPSRFQSETQRPDVLGEPEFEGYHQTITLGQPLVHRYFWRAEVHGLPLKSHPRTILVR